MFAEKLPVLLSARVEAVSKGGRRKMFPSTIVKDVAQYAEQYSEEVKSPDISSLRSYYIHSTYEIHCQYPAMCPSR